LNFRITPTLTGGGTTEAQKASVSSQELCHFIILLAQSSHQEVVWNNANTNSGTE